LLLLGRPHAQATKPASRVHCNIAFGELVTSFPSFHVDNTIDSIVPVLLDILGDVPYIDFDKSLSWEGKQNNPILPHSAHPVLEWALPDQLVFSTVSALLRISNSHPQYRELSATAINAFISLAAEKIMTETRKQAHLQSAPKFMYNLALNVLTQLTPAIHGLYRAMISTSFPWTSSQWETLSTQFNILCAPDVVDCLNQLLVDIFRAEELDSGTIQFTQTFVARYISRGRPLSGYFIICCVMEIQWTVLAQALSPSQMVKSGNIVEAAAANTAWLTLMRQAATNSYITDGQTMDILKKTINYAMQCFTDLLVQLEEMDSDPPLDTYAWETLSESLVCAFIPSASQVLTLTKLEIGNRVLCGSAGTR
jgi:phosphatidylinositol 4-kinase